MFPQNLAASFLFDIVTASRVPENQASNRSCSFEWKQRKLLPWQQEPQTVPTHHLHLVQFPTNSVGLHLDTAWTMELCPWTLSIRELIEILIRMKRFHVGT